MRSTAFVSKYARVGSSELSFNFLKEEGGTESTACLTFDFSGLCTSGDLSSALDPNYARPVPQIQMSSSPYLSTQH